MRRPRGGRTADRPAQRAVGRSRARSSTRHRSPSTTSASSPLVSPRLAAMVGAKSGAWVPMIAEARVDRRARASRRPMRSGRSRADELALLQALAVGGGARARAPPLGGGALRCASRASSGSAEIVRRIRAELEPAEVVRVAREELRSTPRLDEIAIDVTDGEARVRRGARAASRAGRAAARRGGRRTRSAPRCARLRCSPRTAAGSTQQEALLHAAQVVTGELELQPVLEPARRGGDEAARRRRGGLLPARPRARRAALRGSARISTSARRLRVHAGAGVAGAAIVAARPVSAGDYSTITAPVPSPAYDGFSRALVAPMVWARRDARRARRRGSATRRARSVPTTSELLEAFASLASLALRNAESFAERSRQARVQRGFYRIASLLGEPLSLWTRPTTPPRRRPRRRSAETSPPCSSAAPAGSPSSAVTRCPPAVRELDRCRALLAAAPRTARCSPRRRVADDERFDGAWRDRRRSRRCSRSRCPARGRARARLVHGRARLRARRPRARAAGGRRGDVARSSAAACSRPSARRAVALPAARAHRQPARDRARPGGGARGGGQRGGRACSHADAAALAAARGRRARRHRRVGDGAGAGARRALAGDRLGRRRRRRAVARAGGARGHARERRARRRRMPSSPAATRAYLGVPLAARGGRAARCALRLLGCEPRAWREEEVQALVALAANASVALSNAELYQRVAVEREQSVAILANIADGIVAVDRDGHVVLWNQRGRARSPACLPPRRSVARLSRCCSAISSRTTAARTG